MELSKHQKQNISGDNQCKRVLEGLNSAVLLFNQDLELRYINVAGEILLQMSANRVLGECLDTLFIDNQLVTTIREAQQGSDQISRRGLNITLHYGHPITIDLIITHIMDSKTGTDLLVEMTQVDRQLRISREEGLLSQGSASRALVRGLAHEIKNPLGGLRGAAQLLERELHDEELKEYTQIIISEADRLHKLIDEMLGPKSPPKPQLINIHQAVERVRQIVSVEVKEGIEIRSDYDPSIPELYIDLDQIIQALLNLVRNATQVIDDSGKIVIKTRVLRSFTIGQTQHRLVARIDVIDNGPGIDPKLGENIFLPMITGRTDGTGLGLPIAQSLININGGLIEWESQPGITQFSILLPIEIPERKPVRL